MSAIDSVLKELQSDGNVSATDIAHARSVARQAGSRPDQVLVKLGLVTERKLFDAYQSILAIDLIDPDTLPSRDICDGDISLKYLKTEGVLPVGQSGEELVVATADPLNDYAEKALRLATGRRVRFCLAPKAALSRAVDALYETTIEHAPPNTETLQDTNDSAVVADAEMLRDLASRAPIIQYVEELFARAASARASDIHVEPFERALQVRFRIDGILQDADERPIAQAPAIISRLKILSGLDIGENRLPQDGRTKIVVEGKRMDVRVATTPTVFGERVVLRLLDTERALLTLDNLGFGAKTRGEVDKILSDPHGLFLVTGPTGSGKTTTLYACLQALNGPNLNIVTVEDPVEYQIPGINQVQVKSQIGLSFASVLRSLVRQDPDVMMIGEIRDKETADIAVHAALTGHLVLSTVHTNSAAATIMRLLDMGIEPYLLASVLCGAVSQRLVRRLCDKCKTPFQTEASALAPFGANLSGPATLYKQSGCEHCGGTGFRGRVAISEILTPTQALRDAIAAAVDVSKLQRLAVDGGMVPLLSDGAEKVLAGQTTLDEIMRVTKS